MSIFLEMNEKSATFLVLGRQCIPAVHYKTITPCSLLYLVDFSNQRIVVSRAKVGESPLFCWSNMALSFSPLRKFAVVRL